MFEDNDETVLIIGAMDDDENNQDGILSGWSMTGTDHGDRKLAIIIWSAVLIMFACAVIGWSL